MNDVHGLMDALDDCHIGGCAMLRVRREVCHCGCKCTAAIWAKPWRPTQMCGSRRSSLVANLWRLTTAQHMFLLAPLFSTLNWMFVQMCGARGAPSCPLPGLRVFRAAWQSRCTGEGIGAGCAAGGHLRVGVMLCTV